MKRFWYLRDKDNKPRVTICEAVNKAGEKAVGVAICSMKDNPSKKIGRTIAEGRCRQAWIKRGFIGPVFRASAQFVLEISDGHLPDNVNLAYKSQYYGAV